MSESINKLLCVGGPEDGKIATVRGTSFDLVQYEAVPVGLEIEGTIPLKPVYFAYRYEKRTYVFDFQDYKVFVYDRLERDDACRKPGRFLKTPGIARSIRVVGKP